MDTTTSPAIPTADRVATVARALTAASVLLSAVVHLELWATGMKQVDVIGPAFLLNAVGGLAIAVAVLLWRHWLPLLAAIGFGAATLGAFVMSMTVGLFGVREQVWGVPQVLSAVSEITAIGFALVALAAGRPGARRSTDEPQAVQASTT
jgi:hypothetical protein